ncbi:MAG: cytochrome P450 [Alphaproteobacteria bacterium]
MDPTTIDHGIDPHIDPYSIPLEQMDVSHPVLFWANTMWDFFKRLREEDPVHYCPDSLYGPYWSVTKYADIVHVETNPQIFSSDQKLGGIAIQDDEEDFPLPMFIAMDPPKHDAQRKVVQPIVSGANLARFEPIIRERAGQILDALPTDRTFDWVDRVSVELTGQMLATLFDFPWEDRRKLTRWSDVATADERSGIIESPAARHLELLECGTYFTRLWNERVNAEPAPDLISMLAHGEATRTMSPEEYLGNVILLIVGGNDTTRNSITGGVLALNENPEEYDKLRTRPDLIPNMVSEIIRWQTPLAHMRRTALQDTELRGKTIRKGDRVVMLYVSGNRDEDAIPQANRFLIDRERARNHLSFGFGIHRCVGNRLAELQLRIIWEEIMARFAYVQVMEPPKRIYSNFVKGYASLPVRVHRK